MQSCCVVVEEDNTCGKYPVLSGRQKPLLMAQIDGYEQSAHTQFISDLTSFTSPPLHVHNNPVRLVRLRVCIWTKATHLAFMVQVGDGIWD